MTSWSSARLELISSATTQIDLTIIRTFASPERAYQVEDLCNGTTRFTSWSIFGYITEAATEIKCRPLRSCNESPGGCNASPGRQ
jgi:hypothetical protein